MIGVCKEMSDQPEMSDQLERMEKGKCSMRQIGILGGTFDPIHLGHTVLAMKAKNTYRLDEVWMMPSPNPPHKSEKKVSDYVHRLAMLRIALAEYPDLKYSEFEIRRTGKSYTYQTLSGLKAEYPDVEFSFIMGADSLFEIETWMHPEIILKEARILVAFREYTAEDTKKEATFSELQKQIAYLTAKYMARIAIIRYNRVDISSSMIREMVREGKNFREYVAEGVAEYIAKHRLYLPEVPI